MKDTTVVSWSPPPTDGRVGVAIIKSQSVTEAVVGGD